MCSSTSAVLGILYLHLGRLVFANRQIRQGQTLTEGLAQNRLAEIIRLCDWLRDARLMEGAMKGEVEGVPAFVLLQPGWLDGLYLTRWSEQ